MRRAVRSEVRQSALNMRTTEKLRRHLETEAAKSGRTLSHEVEYRLERSFAEDTSYTTPTNAAMLRDIASFFKLVGFDSRADCNATCRKVLIDCLSRIVSAHLTTPKVVTGLMDMLTGPRDASNPFDNDPEREELFEKRCVALVEAIISSSDIPEIVPTIKPPSTPFGFVSSLGGIDSGVLKEMGLMPPSPADLSKPPEDKASESPKKVRRSVNKKDEDK
ncbi:hypothetical protein [Methylobacterium platani]|uniref:hypothetical protein n=1 Tax=Methylobacterium platani TaxID=427683 RepID=UPI000A94EC5F|nr:hypothetical protein [Methylobacterium platani]